MKRSVAFLSMAFAAIISFAFVSSASAQISTVLDPVGDILFRAPAFQDIVRGRMTKTASGNFEMHMEMAGPVSGNPPLLPPGRSEIWWGWVFDLDPTAFPQGYPFGLGGEAVGRRPEFIVYVSWNGTEFAGTAIDRRPLLTGGAAIITPVPFSINGTIAEAVLASTLIGDVPPSFRWGPLTIDWSGPVGTEGVNTVDIAETVFNP